MSKLIKIKPDSEAAKLFRQLGSRKPSEFLPASEAFAAFIAGVALKVIETYPAVGNLFYRDTFQAGNVPSIPLDPYFDIRERGFIQTWTQQMPGGLATSMPQGLDEVIVSTYTLNSALSLLKKYARDARLNVIASSMERMAQEILIKQEKLSASIISAAIANATTVVNGVSTTHVIRANTGGQFVLDDFNKLITLMQRIRPSWVGGTPDGGNTISHIVGSPEIMEEIRSMAYQPQNTRPGSITTEGATALAAPDSVRAEVFNAAGNPSFYGVNLINVYEMGAGNYTYNLLFSKYAQSKNYAGSPFNPSSTEIVWALNLNVNPYCLVQLTQSDENGTFQVYPDDSFPVRSEKFGYFGDVTEGRVCLDSRQVAGIIV